jgi:hypothetical protein
MSDRAKAGTDTARLLAEIRTLRAELETQTAINIVEGINTVETLALVAHFLRKRRAPTAKELRAIEAGARSRWQQQVRHTIGVAQGTAGGLSESLGALLDSVAEPKPKARSRGRKARH